MAERVVFNPARIGKILSGIASNQSNMLAAFAIIILGMLLVPLPNFILDLAFVINFAFSLGILLVTMYVRKSLDFSTFPTILLFVTLLRLALEISATRSILLNGYAGNVIHSVGSFVVGGNFVVGIIIFLILFVINFIVVTQGAGRVSEVAARFALDSMPGKQLAVDADLNAGIIDENEAKTRRKEIAREADFYSTMDGGSKFVKGDAIASIVIAVVNIAAGFVIGMVQLKMSAADAASTYTLLTIGEGLASQIPALVVSVATGIIVTRAEPDLNLAEDIGAQLFSRKEVIGVSAIAMFILGIGIQGAFVPFMMVAGGLGYWTFRKYVEEQQATQGLVKGPDGKMMTEAEFDENDMTNRLRNKEQDNSPDAVMKLLKVDQIEVELGYKLINLIDKEKGGDLMERIGQIRRQVMIDLGLPVPAIRVHDNLQLASNCYQVKLRGSVIASGSVEPNSFLAVNTGLVDEDAKPLDGKATTEPSYGLPAVWVNESERDRAETNGYTVATPSSVLATHLTEIIRSFAGEILSRQDFVKMLEQVKESNETIVTEISDVIGTGEILAVLQLLLAEQVAIRDLSSILEHLISYAKVNKDPEYLAERVREGLGRQICSEFLSEGKLNAVTFHPSVEEEMINSVHMGRLALDPMKTKAIIENLKEAYQGVTEQGLPPVILCNAKVRLPLRKIIERTLTQFAVLSYSEVPSTVDAQSVATIQI
ncbi:MAG: flagellar biosynthesis protein FlhA [Cyanobacteria bacterium]|nr:flagellar biosynthesis protein FlhA [Cyanobacteriota bacterium]MDA1020516.1 flagellar biosynthesis protein FlhA [Cyanobacteriota bacterium]